MDCIGCGKSLPRKKTICGSCSVYRARKRRMLRALDYKGGKCQTCGYARSEWSLSFHHVDPSTKNKDIKFGNTLSWARMQPELDKCVLVCNNCHGELHAEILRIDHAAFFSRGEVVVVKEPVPAFSSWEEYKGPKRFQKEQCGLTPGAPTGPTEKESRVCPVCQSSFYASLGRIKFCSIRCASRAARKVERPTKEELASLIWQHPFIKLGAMYGVTDNSIRKWCKAYGITDFPPKGHWARVRAAEKRKAAKI